MSESQLQPALTPHFSQFHSKLTSPNSPPRLVPGLPPRRDCSQDMKSSEQDFLLVLQTIFINFPLTQLILLVLLRTKDKANNPLESAKDGTWGWTRVEGDRREEAMGWESSSFF